MDEVWLLSLAQRPTLGRVLLVSNFSNNFTIIKATVPLGTVEALETLSCPHPDVRLTIKCCRVTARMENL